MTGRYRFAGLTIQIDSLFSVVHDYCVDYRSSDEPDHRIEIKKEDIEAERESYERMLEHEGLPDTGVTDAYLEKLAVYRKIAEWMPSRGVFLMHGSSISVDNEGYLFTARSGTGKSTHTRLWRQLLGDRALMINDDKPLIKIDEKGGAIACGTPWDGKHHLSTNIAVPLRAICILERALKNNVVEITKAEAYPMLLQQIYRPKDPIPMMETLKLIDKMRVHIYQLGCNQDISAAELSYTTMKG